MYITVCFSFAARTMVADANQLLVELQYVAFYGQEITI